MKKTLFGICMLVLVTSAVAQQQFYELREYSMKFGNPSTLHTYLEDALLPSLNALGVENIGVFEEVADALPKKLYLFIPYDDMASYTAINDALEKDSQFIAKSEAYSKADPNGFPIRRIQTSFMTAFEGIPQLIKPANGSMLFELRIYEAYNEDALDRKVAMFNDSELGIFKDVGLHSVFFGKNIAGSQMPCLTYLLGFKDMAERDANWAKFGPHPEWERIRKLPEYANTVSDITRIFLKPLSYSQL
ncbi:NIPSNAP family protein [Eudoraea chungangensis]|uniref:NIPSNAP family protein n=1 Tax=Eudoraea chungangensis TaxID=1481905 RepID=UPI0023ED07AF|nr:NIPSNAP family protein [Eudoraea chungangensis]